MHVIYYFDTVCTKVHASIVFILSPTYESITRYCNMNLLLFTLTCTLTNVLFTIRVDILKEFTCRHSPLARNVTNVRPTPSTSMRTTVMAVSPASVWVSQLTALLQIGTGNRLVCCNYDKHMYDVA